VSSRIEKKNTTNESIAAETMLASARTIWTVAKEGEPILLSRSRNNGTEKKAASVEMAGTTQNEDFKKLSKRFRKAHDIVSVAEHKRGLRSNS
jgi:hypothetical protein